MTHTLPPPDAIDDDPADWLTAPATHPGIAGVTLAEYERRRAEVAMRLNPAVSLEVMNGTRRGRPKGSGCPPRKTRTVKGVTEIWCSGCRDFHPTNQFYRMGKTWQGNCKKMQARGQGWRRRKANKQAALADHEAMTNG